ncbi:hypothetical protein PI124_g19360 [Phytophthora idaei]|nr:hypothetical protein PI125_g20986 [Phytophthora idaei]KAG3133113.1 hypothetical protein PI126_g19311 [Phytophthora idaei]KAG3235608.1 hypothetical protein PI124_g19360 [Phytophthora idaei]
MFYTGEVMDGAPSTQAYVTFLGLLEQYMVVFITNDHGLLGTAHHTEEVRKSDSPMDYPVTLELESERPPVVWMKTNSGRWQNGGQILSVRCIRTPELADWSVCGPAGVTGCALDNISRQPLVYLY